MELNSARRMFEDKQEDDEAEFNPLPHEDHKFNHLPFALDILYSTETLPSRLRKGKGKCEEVKKGSQDPRTPRDAKPPHPQEPESATKPMKDPIPIPPSPACPPHIGDAFAKKTDNESSDMTTPELSGKSSPTSLLSGTPCTNVIQPSLPSYHTSSPPTEPFSFANIGTPRDSNMDIDKAATSAKDLHAAVAGLKASCEFLFLFLFNCFSIHLQYLLMIVMSYLLWALETLVITISFIHVSLSNTVIV